MVTSLYCETIGYGVPFDSTLIPVKVLCTLYTMRLLVSSFHLQRVALMVMGKSWSVSNIAEGRLATLSLLGGCAGPERKQSSMFNRLLIWWCWWMCALKPSFKSQELGLSGVFTVTFLWTATGGTIGHFWSSSWLSWECIALGRGRVRSWSLPDLAHTFELTCCQLLLFL